MDTFKIIIHEASILVLHENLKVGANFIIFYEAELMKVGIFDN
jgi:hypothetical protein